MSGLVYGGRFEQMMTEFCSPRRIGATAKKFAKLEKQHGAYAFGKFARPFMPKPPQWANRGKDSAATPEQIRKRLTEIISTNLKSKSPMPMVLKRSDNVDPDHDLYVKA